MGNGSYQLLMGEEGRRLYSAGIYSEGSDYEVWIKVLSFRPASLERGAYLREEKMERSREALME